MNDAKFTRPEEKREAQGRLRLKVLFVTLWVGYSLIFLRGILLALEDNQRLDTMAMRQYRAAIQDATNRGRILDHKGSELAISVPAWSVYTDPREVKAPQELAQTLAPILQVSVRDLNKKFASHRKFVWVKRRVDAEMMEKLRALNPNPSGIYSLKENMRYYPHGHLAAGVMGAVGIDSQALAGIELQYDSYLKVTPYPELYQRDAKGRLMSPSAVLQPIGAKGDVYLTIDKNIQFFAEEALEKAVAEHHAKSGVLLAADPATGAILAMAVTPSFDPNNYRFAKSPVWHNPAVTDIYEPGSTFKPITLAAALESGKIHLEDEFDCEHGSLRLANGQVINDSHPHDRLTVAEIVKVSSNIGILKVGKKTGKTGFYQMIRNFGFGEKSRLDFPGEAFGLVTPLQQWSIVDEGTIAFGQGIGVTPLQMLMAYATLANHGLQMKPYLVQAVVGPEGQPLYQAEPEVMRQPITETTARQITRVLQSVVKEGGTGTKAALAEYSVAGKTGTSQKADPNGGGYLAGSYTASFVGFAPAEDPKLVILVLIDQPQGPAYFGGEVAAPVFQEVMLRSLQVLGVPSQQQSKIVFAERPEAKNAVIAQETAETFRIPDFAGVPMRGVLKALEGLPLQLQIKGRGFAVAQSPGPGTLAKAGESIYVEFKSFD